MSSVTPTIPVNARTLLTAKCPKSQHSRRAYGRFEGQTTVEFALICLPFFLILFALLDYAQIYFYKNALQNGLREACRFTTAGRVIQAYNTNGTPAYETNLGVVSPKAINDDMGREASRNECTRYWFQSNCVVYMPLSNIAIVSTPTLPGVPPYVTTNSFNGDLDLTNSPTGTLNKGPGAANDYVQVSATFYLSTITPLFGYLGGYSRGAGSLYSYRVYVSAIVKNEPALLNFEHTNIYAGEP